MKSNHLLGLARQCIQKYNMIEAGDKILVAVSGGKDSVVLALVLNSLAKFYPQKFELQAVTINNGFSDMDFSPIQKLFDKNKIQYTVINTKIKEIVFDNKSENSKCSLCARLRRGALLEIASKLNCNKIALGHHKDDVINTFMMSLVYEGRLNCFCPVTDYENKGIKIIRPFVYISESSINKFANDTDIPIVKNNCPAEKSTARNDIKDIISELKSKTPDIKEKIFTAVENSNIYGWNDTEK